MERVNGKSQGEVWGLRNLDCATRLRGKGGTQYQRGNLRFEETSDYQTEV